MNTRQKALVVVPSFILAVAGILGVLGHFAGIALGLPSRFGMPFLLRGAGVLVLIIGFSLMGWILKYRRPIEIVISTYESIEKARKGVPLGNTRARTEPLILNGPQRYVRHPMYFAVVLLFVGWWLALDCTLLLFMAFFFFLWFNLVVIRFEEKELKSLYGNEYEIYARTVPKFFPSWRCKWR
jgi:protein-S-isoprenylcysteine O-methyltransferase Ste14